MSEIHVTPDSTSEDNELIVGEALVGFLSNVAAEAASSRLRNDAIDILSRARVNRSVPSGPTGLVVGRIQSGKTMSYEALITLARDNDFPLIIVISGISNTLLGQGEDRLTEDLEKAFPRGWHFMVNPEIENARDKQLVSSLIENWRDADTPPKFRKPLVVLALKHHDRLARLSELFGKFDWSGLPVLIVDDEADQASLNTLVRRGDTSSTYSALLELRRRFDHHAFIQYTATPQAPLLIQIADSLSPDFVKVLEPGVGYTGGEVFFQQHPELVKTIPATEVLAPDHGQQNPPESLLEALRVFVVGLGYSLYVNETEPRSMVIHPSRLTGLHESFAQWVRAIRQNWLQIISSREDEPGDYDDFVLSMGAAWSDLNSTIQDFPKLEVLLPMIKFGLRNTQVVEMNTRDGRPIPDVAWDDAQGFILIGGQALDRGFTVKGLTVTYMPRDPGMGNADTLQQRARFFGYKGKYVGLCRVYLEGSARNAFEQYVEHELDMHQRLRAVEISGESLKDWQRAFLLDTSMRPTRDAVLSTPDLRASLSDEWSFDHRPSFERDLIAKNKAEIDIFRQNQSLTALDGHIARTPAQKHLVTSVRLDSVLGMLAAQTVVDPADSLERTGLLVQLTKALESNADEECWVLWMRPEHPERRTVSKMGVVPLFQGRSRRTKEFEEGVVYAGDRAMHAEDQVSLQIHIVDISTPAGLLAQVPMFAIWVPERLAAGWIVQLKNE